MPTTPSAGATALRLALVGITASLLLVAHGRRWARTAIRAAPVGMVWCLGDMASVLALQDRLILLLEEGIPSSGAISPAAEWG